MKISKYIISYNELSVIDDRPSLLKIVFHKQWLYYFNLYLTNPLKRTIIRHYIVAEGIYLTIFVLFY